MKSFLRHIRNILLPYHKNEIKVNDIELTRPIYVFYHIYCGKGDWKSIFDEQVLLMRKSSLYDNVTKFYLTIIGNDVDNEYILRFFPDEKVEIVYFSQDGSCFEFPCLQKMSSLSNDERFYALYLHTKGSSYCIERFNGDYNKFQILVDNVSAWRALLNYYNIERWQMAVSSLNSGFTTYGCLLMEQNKNVKSHYSGNFWWTTSENCAKSEEFNDSNISDRWNAEQWIINDSSKPYCAFYSYVLFYGFQIQSSTWLKPWWSRENIAYAINHWKEGRKHLLY